jgi:hypothetical protein
VLACTPEGAILVIALVNLLFGFGFALVARERIRADGPLPSPAFSLVALHAAAVVAPIALYFYAVHPAWSWMYRVDPSKVSGLAIVPLTVGHAGLVLGGWYLAATLLRRGLGRPLRYATAVLGVVLVVVVLTSLHRLGTAADFLGFASDRGTSLFNVQLGWALVVSLLALTGSATYVVIELGRDSRRVRTR